MKIKALVWMGIKTETFQQMEQFLQEVMGLGMVQSEREAR